jgi:two-component system, NtrC family, response regulator
VLAQHFLQTHAAAMNKKLRGLSEDAMAAIEAHAWPGNVREMENRIKGGVAISDGPSLSASDLGLSGARKVPVLTLREVRDDAEKRAVLQALAAADGNVTRAAALLGVSRPTVYDLIGRHEIKVEAVNA